MTSFRIALEDCGAALPTLNRERLNAFSMGYAPGEARPGGWSRKKKPSGLAARGS